MLFNVHLTLVNTCLSQWRGQAKILEGAKCLTSGEQQYFFGTPLLKMLKIWGVWPPGYAYGLSNMRRLTKAYFLLAQHTDE